ncbi:MAG: hypothetical protein AABP62_17990 [Planctomycetota bacterium]
MAVTFEQVRSALDPEEPAYNKAAANLGTEALPHLAKIIAGDHAMLASKAAYLAGLIGTEQSVEVLHRAARSGDVRVRIAAAAAAAAGKLPPESVSDVLINLIDDADVGVQKLALKAVPVNSSPALRARIESLSTTKTDTLVRSLSREVLGRMPASTSDQGTNEKSTGKKKGKPKK